MKIVTIVGARPQFVKAAALSRELAARNGIEEILVHTGQHYDTNMSEIFFRQMGIPEPDYNLGVGGTTHGAMTGRQLEEIEKVLLREHPNWVLVYGDTNSTLAGALAAAKLHIPVAHVEAGLRSFNRDMPEEINRVVTDHVASVLFAPTEGAKENLLAEGVASNRICVAGDVMFDAVMFYRERAVRPGWFDNLGIQPGEYVLCTIHRAENTDVPDRIAGIFEGLGLSGRPVVLPLHPRTRARIADLGLEPPGNIHITEPVGYLEMTWLEAHCYSIATDSGGVQKEAFFHGKACTTLRDETEWIELVDAGANVVVATDPERIREALRRRVPSVAFEQRLYGDGKAASLIVDALQERTA